MPRLLDFQDAIDQLGHAHREDRIHVVPEFPLSQHAVDAAAAGKALAEAIQEGIEIVVADDERLLIGMGGVVVGQMANDLQADGRLSLAFFAEHHGRGRIRGIAVDLVPRGVIGALDAKALEDLVGLRVLVGERVAGDALVFEELLDVHAGCSLAASGFRRSAVSLPHPALRSINVSLTVGCNERQQRSPRLGFGLA